MHKLACRSAFRLTQPDHLGDSHLLRLWFEYDDRPTKIRQRFKLVGAGIFPFEDVLKPINEVTLRLELRAFLEAMD